MQGEAWVDELMRPIASLSVPSSVYNRIYEAVASANKPHGPKNLVDAVVFCMDKVAADWQKCCDRKQVEAEARALHEAAVVAREFEISSGSGSRAISHRLRKLARSRQEYIPDE